MKRNGNLTWLRLAAAVLSVLGFALRGGLYAFGVDEKNLIRSGHPLEIALWAVTALAVILILAAVRKMEDTREYETSFQASLSAGIGHIICAGGIALTVLLNAPLLAGPVGLLWKLSGILSAALLLWAAFSRCLGKKPFFLCHMVPSIFFALHLVVHYRLWCSDPQLQNYVFAFGGAIGLMFVGYGLAAFEAGQGSRRSLVAAGLIATYLCVVSLAGTEYLYLYLGGAAWAFTGLCNGIPQPRKKEAGEADEHG